LRNNSTNLVQVELNSYLVQFETRLFTCRNNSTSVS